MAATPLDGGARRISHALPRAPGGDVVEARYSPDGTHVVFRADREKDEVIELYSVPASGGTPVKLNGPLALDTDVQPGFLFSPDGARVVFLVRAGGFSVDAQLFSVPVDGSAPAALLAPVIYAFAPVYTSSDGTLVLYREGGALMARAIDAGAPAFEVAPRVAGRAVVHFDVSPVASRAVYLANQDDVAQVELYAVDLAPGAVSTKLNAPLVAGGTIAGSGSQAPFAVAPDGGRVVYRADQDVEDVFELFSVPISGGTPVRVSPAGLAAASQDAYAYAVDPTSTYVVFDVGPNGFSNSLHASPLDGSVPPVLLTLAVSGFGIDPTGARVVFRNSLAPFSSRRDLYSVPIDASSGETFLGTGDVTSFTIDATGTRVAYAAFDVNGFTAQLASTPIDTSVGSVVVPTSAAGPMDDFRFSPDGQHLLYRADLDAAGRFELYRAPAAGGAPPTRLNAALPPGGHVEAFEVDPGSTAALLLADESLATVLEAYQAPITGGANELLSGVLVNTNLLGSVTAFRASERRAVYIAHPGDPAQAEVFGVSFAGEARARPLAPGQYVDPEALVITPGATRALYLATNTGPAGDLQLWSAPFDGSTPPVLLGTDMRADGATLPYACDASGTLVFFLSDKATEDVRELYLAPVDGSFPALRWSAPLVPGGDVVEFAVSSATSRVVYRADAASNEEFGLHSKAVGSPAVRLDGPLVPGGDVTDFEVSPDGTFAVYRADQDADEVFELYRVPLDGGAAPVRLSSAMPTGGDVIEFRITSDSTRVVYLADQLVNARDELFSVPSDASAAPVRLNNNLPSGGDVYAGFLTTAAQPIVVFRAANIGTLDPALFVAPLDGGAPAVRLVDTDAPIGAVLFPQLTDDGTQAVFSNSNRSHLYSVPTDGSSGPVQIDANPSVAFLVHSFRPLPGSEEAVYLSRTWPNGPYQLFLARVDGVGEPLLLNRPVSSLGNVAADYLSTPSGDALLFRVEDQDPDAFELFLRAVGGHVGGAGAPH